MDKSFIGDKAINSQEYSANYIQKRADDQKQGQIRQLIHLQNDSSTILFHPTNEKLQPQCRSRLHRGRNQTFDQKKDFYQCPSSDHRVFIMMILKQVP